MEQNQEVKEESDPCPPVPANSVESLLDQEADPEKRDSLPFFSIASANNSGTTVGATSAKDVKPEINTKTESLDSEATGKQLSPQQSPPPTAKVSNLKIEGMYNLRSPAVKRILREAAELATATDQYFAQPLEDNIFEWHFTIRGPRDTEFEDGIYHGRVILPPEYPMKPPSIIMLTESGRFETGTKICLSISAYHPETWRPSWSIRTALLGLIAYMATDSAGAIGSMTCTPAQRRSMARKSQVYECHTCGPIITQMPFKPINPDNANQKRKFCLPHGNLPSTDREIPRDAMVTQAGEHQEGVQDDQDNLIPNEIFPEEALVEPAVGDTVMSAYEVAITILLIGISVLTARRFFIYLGDNAFPSL